MSITLRNVNFLCAVCAEVRYTHAAALMLSYTSAGLSACMHKYSSMMDQSVLSEQSITSYVRVIKGQNALQNLYVLVV